MLIIHATQKLLNTSWLNTSLYISQPSEGQMLAHMNQMVIQLEFECSRFNSYDNISQDLLEERMMDYLYQAGDKTNIYITATDYWKQRGVIG